MAMEKALAVNTCLGILKGRDCIYLDEVKQDDANNLTFKGGINGHLISVHQEVQDWFTYTLTFRQVVAYFCCELETYTNYLGGKFQYVSSFDVIEESHLLKSLLLSDDLNKGIYRHYRLFTYDEVFNIIAASYEFKTES